MNILALDTSTEYCSVALWRDGDVDADEVLAGRRHSQLLLPMIGRLLDRHGMALAGLDGIAFGAGPGSFTGLRIGCGVTQGLAWGAGLPVVAVSTLMAMAQAAGADSAVCCLDARMGQIYHGAYRGSGNGWTVVCAPSVCAPGEAPPLPPGSWTACGSGFSLYARELEGRYSGCLTAVLREIIPHARDIAALAALELRAGRALSPDRAVPVYIRDKVALKSGER